MTASQAFWRHARPLLLASGSVTRLGLVAAAGLPVESLAADLDERALQHALGLEAGPVAIAAALASAKADRVSAMYPDRVVVGADQVLALDGHMMGKPADAAHAVSQLARLSGRTHELHSAVAIRAPGAAVDFVETASLTLRRLDAPAIARYVAAAGPAILACAGGYQIETVGIHLFERIVGEHTTILGLPMLPLLAALRRLSLLES